MKIKCAKFHLTESGAKFLNEWNKNFDDEYEKRFGGRFFTPRDCDAKAGYGSTMAYDCVKMLMTTVFMAAFPQPAIIIDDVFIKEC